MEDSDGRTGFPPTRFVSLSTHSRSVVQDPSEDLRSTVRRWSIIITGFTGEQIVVQSPSLNLYPERLEFRV